MNTFQEMGLSDPIIRAVSDLGFTSPTPVQEKAIPQILTSDNDLIGLAQTGTGKTAAFGLPILEQLDWNEKSVQAIILCPTRELCLQITADLETYAKYMDNAKIQSVYGGADIKKQIRGLKAKPQIVVGTPGRTLDLIRRRDLKIDEVNFVVLDEADEMLNMGFREDIDTILEETPREKQTLLFSATMPKEVRRIASDYMFKPVEIQIGSANQSAKNVEHHYYMVRASDRYLALKRLADYHPDIYAIVFCRTRRETKDVADKLIQDGYNADALHGDLSQAQRDTVMDKFRRGQLQLLVATDVAARGIDVDELTHVINYNLPDDPEVYVHRSGRTGRAGNKGISIVIAHSREGKRIRELEKLIKKEIQPKEVPTGKEIVERRLFASIDKIERILVDDAQIEPYMETITERLAWIDRDELLKRFVAVEFNTFLDYYRNAEDLNVGESKGESREARRRRNRNMNMTRFFFPVGKKHKMTPARLMGIINETTGKGDIEIGEIEILRNFSFFEADKDFEKLILDSFAKEEYRVEVSQPIGNKSSDTDSRRRKPKRREFQKRGSYGNSGRGSFRGSDRKGGKRRR